MIRTVIQAGLGNQLFQYACAYSLAKKWNTRLVLDTSFFDYYNKSHPEVQREYCLDKFAIKPDRLINNPNGFWRYRLRTKCSLIQRIDGMPFILEDIENCRENQMHLFQRVREENATLFGFWQNTIYFKDILNDIQEQFKPAYSFCNEVHKCLINIMNSNSVGIHIRRGDFVRLGWDKEIDYYYKGMSLLRSKIDNPHFYIVSDDILWAKERFSDFTDVTFISLNSITKDTDEFFLLSSCKHQIISESTYGWWAAYLNTNPNKIICVPKDAMGDIFNHGWFRI